MCRQHFLLDYTRLFGCKRKGSLCTKPRLNRVSFRGGAGGGGHSPPLGMHLPPLGNHTKIPLTDKNYVSSNLRQPKLFQGACPWNSPKCTLCGHTSLTMMPPLSIQNPIFAPPFDNFLNETLFKCVCIKPHDRKEACMGSIRINPMATKTPGVCTVYIHVLR